MSGGRLQRWDGESWHEEDCRVCDHSFECGEITVSLSAVTYVGPFNGVDERVFHGVQTGDQTRAFSAVDAVTAASWVDALRSSVAATQQQAAAAQQHAAATQPQAAATQQQAAATPANASFRNWAEELLVEAYLGDGSVIVDAETKLAHNALE
eukprot:1653766-Prymnesium_polylepis.1